MGDMVDAKRTLDAVILDDSDLDMLSSNEGSVAALIRKYVLPINEHHAALNEKSVMQGHHAIYDVPVPFSVLDDNGRAMTYTRYNQDTGKVSSKWKTSDHRTSIRLIFENIMYNLEHGLVNLVGPRLVVMSQETFDIIMKNKDGYEDFLLGTRTYSSSSTKGHWKNEYELKPYFHVQHLVKAS